MQLGTGTLNVLHALDVEVMESDVESIFEYASVQGTVQRVQIVS